MNWFFRLDPYSQSALVITAGFGLMAGLIWLGN